MLDSNHCSICGSLLKKDEFDICKTCANKFGLNENLFNDQKIIHKKQGIKRYKGSIKVNHRP